MSGAGLDLAIIVIYFVVIIGIGLYAARGQKTMETYALGNRSMPWWAVLASILASEISAGTFLGTPSEGYAKLNFLYAQLVIGTILARLLVAGIFIKPFYDLKVVSIYEFLEIRFGRVTRRLSSFVFLLTRSLASGSRIFVAAILLVLAWEVMHPEFRQLEGAARFQQELFIYVGAVVVITFLTALYTTLGGIKAVVWTDLIQVSLMFGSAAYVFFWLLGKTGGWEGFTSSITPSAGDINSYITTGIDDQKSFGENVRSILSQEYTIWAAFLGSVFTTLATHGTDQDMVQRMLTSKDHKKGQRSVIVSGLIDLPVVVGFLAIGILLHRFYTENAHRAPDHDPGIFAWFMVHDLAPGLRGLLAAGLFATAMGSLSTALNALATTFTKDWYVGYFRPQASSNEQFKAARWATVGFAVLLALIGIGTAFIKLKNPDLRIIPIVLGSFGYTYGSLLGVFLIGMLTKTRGNCRGNVIAMVAGLLVVCFFSSAHNDVHDIFHDKEAKVRKALVSLKAAPSYSTFAPESFAEATPELVAQVAEKSKLPEAEVRALWSSRTSHEPWYLPSWMPVFAFTWRIMLGTLVTVAVGLCFRRKGDAYVARTLA
ncbi:sodium/solute symporter [Luteolibacter flavescens]|uniref:Sodium/solute symporter n=1 Tax=Luteolibacter flavescens TaxID=1859460 RepID=A0ABT3FT87_9BACT|nr:sodium/solute symporter [Luteolibacter flavescens]MCW1886788.1 sodium/solute symporter [Luteolibacter flavescens]